ncbi:MAG TPA: AAA family ATPase [Myxococcales bacterium]|jgi:chromosome partitioning protein
MGRIFAISNQKGGVGKTTTAINLGASLASDERKTLVVDIDPQANAGSGLGIDVRELEKSIYDVLLGEATFDEVVLKTELKFLDVLPAARDLAGAEVELVGLERREFRLREALAKAKSKYDYILIDCPPSLSLLTINALVAADAVLIPLQTEYFALEGISELLNTVELVKQELNPKLELEGIVLTMYDPRLSIAHQVAEEARNHFEDKVFDTVIPRNVRLTECPSYGKPIVLYDLRSKGCESYLSLARELQRRRRPSRKSA